MRFSDEKQLGAIDSMSTPPNIAVAGICERDVDLLLLEEFVASETFRDWFLIEVIGNGISLTRLIHAARSATFSNGESDLELTFESEDGKKIRLLIENKISAGLQPLQAERYRERGESYVRCGSCDQFRTVLIAPSRYFGEGGSQKGFDATLTYEAIRDHLGLSGDERACYLHYMLSKAIEKATHGWQLVEDEPVTRFWRRYWELVCELAPELELQEPAPKPSGSCFVYFRPIGLPPNVSLYHKVAYGNVDLQFAGMGNRLSELRAKFGPKLTSDMSIKKASKSAVIRIKVSRIDMTEDVAAFEGRITEGIRAAQLLLEWFLEVSISSHA